MSQTANLVQLLRLSQQMLELAKSQQWEALTEIQTQRAQILPELSLQINDLVLTEAGDIAKVIRQIQDIDQQILDYVTPCREQTAALLNRLTSSLNRSA